MSRLGEIIRNNKVYVVLTVFIVGVYSIVLLNTLIPIEEEAPPDIAIGEAIGATPQQGLSQDAAVDAGAERHMFSAEDSIRREERLKALSAENPPLYMFLGILNLLLLFVIFIGFIVDIAFLIRYLRKRRFADRLGIPIEAKWGFPDIVRVVLIFLSSGFIFIILQGYFAGSFPILRNNNFNMILSTAITNVVAISVILYFVVVKQGQTIAAVGIRTKHFMKEVWYAIVGYISFLPVLLLIMTATVLISKFFKYEPPVQPIIEVFMEEKQTAVLWVSTLFAAIFGPVAEEIFFRGFMYPAIKRKAGMFGGMLLSAAVFSVLHAHAAGFLPILALGFLLAYLYEKTGSLVAPITVHIMHNLGMVILVFLMRYANVL